MNQYFGRMLYSRSFFLSIGLFCLFSLTPESLSAQLDTIKVVKHAGTKYWYQGDYLQRPQLRGLLRQDPEAFSQFKKGDIFYVVEVILLSAGGFAWGYSIGGLLGGGEFDATAAYIGSGLLVAALPFSLLRKPHTRKAVLLFNKNRNRNSAYVPKVQFGLTSAGVGVRLSF